ncbi:glycosyltransferase family 4 protein [Nodosilinea sp. AN01ver1]|uniref:glycosyltransferase family 4 protein n=1 Tax=Nodosilinea sp. AN01ver1 TaxID=3423362 RepID=UPI003D31B73B
MTTPFRLGVVFTHPTQHHGPLWKKLSEQPNLSVKVLYLSAENQQAGDKLLGNSAQAWDVDLLSGYDYHYLKDLSGKVPGTRRKTIISPELIDQLTPQNFDAVFMQSFVNYSYRLTALLCKLRGIPLIMQNDATILSDGRYSRPRRVVMSFMYPWMMNLADYWLSCGDHNEIHLRHYGIADDKIIRGCHPVDGDRYRQTITHRQADIQRVHRQHAWDDDTLLYGFVAKYIERKSPFEFIEAIVKAHQQNPRMRGIMLGGGDLEPEINARLAQLNGEVINVGFVNQSELPLYYAAMHCFVCTSRIDPHPLVVSEAMASGCPPILSDRCGNWGYSDTVVHRHNGLVYRYGSVSALAAAMVDMADAETRQRYSQRSMEVFDGQDLNFAVQSFIQVANRIRQRRGLSPNVGQPEMPPARSATVPTLSH